ncbi:serine/threonine protein kinase, partial [Myxococcota bacterium]|nr:serine/threonine protein kinase [Myxococcota bacterium]
MSSELAPGMTFEGRFRLERRLGAGGTGTVWLAIDEAEPARPRRAIKLLHAALKPTGRAAGRFAREAEVLLALRHPNIVRAHAFLQYSGGAYLVMDYVEGETLAALMQRTAEQRTQLSLSEVGVLFSQLCAAVQAAHGAGVIHRDLKPHNVIVVDARGEPRVQVLDFGLAKLASTHESDETTIGRTVGSYLYMAPEQALGTAIDERADIFALGSILFELLTMRRAWARDERDRPVPAFLKAVDFDGPNSAPNIAMRIATGERPLPREHRPELPRALDAVVARALAISRDDRHASVGLLSSDFMRALLEPASASGGERTDVTPLVTPKAELDLDVARARLPVLEPVGPMTRTDIVDATQSTEVSEAGSKTVTVTPIIVPRSAEVMMPPRPRRRLFWGLLIGAELAAFAVMGWLAASAFVGDRGATGGAEPSDEPVPQDRIAPVAGPRAEPTA